MQDLGPVRFSHLRAYGRSPAHGYHARTTDTEATRDMERGTAVDALIFGTCKVIGYPGKVRNGREYEAFAAAHPGYEILTMGEFEKSKRMADAVMSSKVAAPYLHGTTQDTILFRWMGLDCRTTPDVRGDGYLTELKTSKSADPVQFVWHAKRMHYHAQMKFQEYGCRSKRYAVQDHWIVCVEATEPHPVTVFHVEPEALDEGEKLLTLWGERLKICEQSGHFPPYVDCTVPLMWPKEESFEFNDEPLEEAA